MIPAPDDKRTIIVDGKPLVLDAANMKFNELTLSDYLDHEYSWVDYLGKQLELANAEMLRAEVACKAAYSVSYIAAKDAGKTDGYAKCVADSDPVVIKAKEYHIDRKEAVGHLEAHLNAWSRNHANAQSRGHTLRQEMKNLNNTIYNPDSSIGEVP